MLAIARRCKGLGAVCNFDYRGGVEAPIADAPPSKPSGSADSGLAVPPAPAPPSVFSTASAAACAFAAESFNKRCMGKSNVSLAVERLIRQVHDKGHPVIDGDGILFDCGFRSGSGPPGKPREIRDGKKRGVTLDMLHRPAPGYFET